MQSAPRPTAFVRTATQNGERERPVFRLRLRYLLILFSFFFCFFFLFFFPRGRQKERALRTRAVRSSYEMFLGKEARVARVAYMRFIIMLQRVRCVTNSVVIILITGGPWVRRNYCREKLVCPSARPCLCFAPSPPRLCSPFTFSENFHLSFPFIKLHSWRQFWLYKDIVRSLKEKNVTTDLWFLIFNQMRVIWRKRRNSFVPLSIECKS